MNLSVTAYNTGFAFQKFGASLPYILCLWVIINIVARQIVNRWMLSQKQASGRNLIPEKGGKS
jgi:multiple sugar transport system permease protein